MENPEADRSLVQPLESFHEKKCIDTELSSFMCSGQINNKLQNKKISIEEELSAVFDPLEHKSDLGDGIPEAYGS